MNKATYILAFRPVNLLMGALIMSGVRSGILRSDFPMSAGESLPFFGYVFSVLPVMAWGYLINDFYDVETDKINRPGKNLFEQKNPRLLLWFLPLAGLGIPAALSLFYHPLYLLPLGLNVLALALLWGYSFRLKGTVLLGNLSVAALGALLVLAPWFCTEDYATISPSALWRLSIYAGFSFFVTLLREIIKDAEDLPGDGAVGMKTLTVRFGIPAAKRWSYGLLFFSVAALLCFAGFEEHSPYQWAFLILAFLGIFIFFRLILAQTPLAFRSVSAWIKIWMLAGVISMCI